MGWDDILVHMVMDACCHFRRGEAVGKAARSRDFGVYNGYLTP